MFCNTLDIRLVFVCGGSPVPIIPPCPSSGHRTRGDCRSQCGRALGHDVPVSVPQIETEARRPTESKDAAPKEGQSLRTRWGKPLPQMISLDLRKKDNFSTSQHLMRWNIVAMKESHDVRNLGTVIVACLGLTGIEPRSNVVLKQAEFLVETVEAGLGEVLVYVEDPEGHTEEVRTHSVELTGSETQLRFSVSTRPESSRTMTRTGPTL